MSTDDNAELAEGLAGAAGVAAGTYGAAKSLKALQAPRTWRDASGRVHWMDAVGGLVGVQPVWHGTTQEAAESILHSGLNREHWGTGEGARLSGSPHSTAAQYLRDSENAIHVATQPGGASWYAHAAYSNTPREAERGRVLGGTVPEDIFREHFQPDTTASHAARSRTYDIPAADLHAAEDFTARHLWNARSPDWVSRVARNPARLKPFAGMLAGGAVALGGAALAGKGLYDHFQTEDPVLTKSAYAAGQKLALAKLGMDLQFSSPEEAAAHNTHRNVAGALLGGIPGAALGGAALGARYGKPGAILGGFAGGLAGSVGGKLLADVAHDVPQRTMATHDNTLERLNLAGGFGTRVAEEKIAAVPKYKKDYRRALQMLLEGDTAFHGTSPAGLRDIASAGHIRPGKVNYYSPDDVAETYLSLDRPALGYHTHPDQPLLAIPAKRPLQEAPVMSPEGPVSPRHVRVHDRKDITAANTYLLTPHSVPLKPKDSVIMPAYAKLPEQRALRLRTIDTPAFNRALEDVHPGAGEEHTNKFWDNPWHRRSPDEYHRPNPLDRDEKALREMQIPESPDALREYDYTGALVRAHAPHDPAKAFLKEKSAGGFGTRIAALEGTDLTDPDVSPFEDFAKEDETGEDNQAQPLEHMERMEPPSWTAEMSPAGGTSTDADASLITGGSV